MLTAASFFINLVLRQYLKRHRPWIRILRNGFNSQLEPIVFGENRVAAESKSVILLRSLPQILFKFSSAMVENNFN